MHKNSLMLLGDKYDRVFSGVIWQTEDQQDLEMLEFKVQEMLDAAHEMVTTYMGNVDEGEQTLDKWINNWMLTGVTNGEQNGVHRFKRGIKGCM